MPALNTGHAPLAIVSGLLVGASALGWGCASELEQSSLPVGSLDHAEFVPEGPVRNEQEAVATAWRYMLADYGSYIQPPTPAAPADTSQLIPVTWNDFTQVNILEPPIMLGRPGGGRDRWEIGWPTKNFDGYIVFAVDQTTGQTEQLEPAGM